MPAVLVDETRMRRWLAHLARPELLADADMRALLRLHGRSVPAAPLEAGRAAARLLADAVEALAPGDGSPEAALSYRVLRTCFLEGAKNRHAAARLGLSERQLSRERSRAIALLTAQLAAPRPPGRGGGPPRRPEPFLPRPALGSALAAALESARRVCVAGPPGCGKTVLVAAHAAASSADVFWYRAAGAGSRPTLPSILFELGEHVAPDDPALASYVRGALPDLDVGLATRIALAALERGPRLLVLDGVAGSLDPEVDAFLDEAVARLPLASVVVAGRGVRGGAGVHVPPLSRRETGDLLGLAGVAADDRLVHALHSWTAGSLRLVARAASWLKVDGAGRASLDEALRQPASLPAALRGLARAARRAAA